MEITIITILTNALMAALMVCIFHIILRGKALYYINNGIMLLCMGVIFIRNIIPVRFFHTKYVQIYNTPLCRLEAKTDRLLTINDRGYALRVSDIAFVISIFLITIFVIRKLVKYIRDIRALKSCARVTDAGIIAIFNKARQDMGCGRSFELVYMKSAASPMIVMAGKTYVIIPRYDMEAKPLYYAFRHELAHYINGDALMHVVLEFAQYMCWWNPFIYILKRQMYEVMELRADEKAVYGSDAVEYTANVLKTARSSIEHYADGGYTAYLKDKSSWFSVRMNAIIKKSYATRYRNMLTNAALTATVALLITLSVKYTITFSPEPEPGIYRIETYEGYTEGTFLVRLGDRRFAFYYEGDYCGEVSYIFDRHTKVYDGYEEAKKHEKIEESN